MSAPVLHFVARWLPESEGFVHDAVRSTDRRAVVVASRPLENVERFPWEPLHSLGGLRHLRPRALQQKAVTAGLLALALREGVGLVHAHHGYDAGMVLGMVRRRRLPLVLSLHGDDVTGLVETVPSYYAQLVPAVAAVVVPSRFLGDLAAGIGFDRRRIRVLPSGIDTTFFSPTPLPEGPPEVLFVGRFVAKKGLDVLARAWPAVCAAVPGARLRLLGFGELEHVARAIPGPAEVVLRPTRAEVRDAMRRARLVVSPSRTAPGDAVESLLVVNLEAQASGRPVVTTDHGGIPEHVLAGRSALVVSEGDAEALAAAVVRVLTDPDTAVRLAAAGPPWAARYDLRRTGRRLDALYDELDPATARAGAA